MPIHLTISTKRCQAHCGSYNSIGVSTLALVKAHAKNKQGNDMKYSLYNQNDGTAVCFSCSFDRFGIAASEFQRAT